MQIVCLQHVPFEGPAAVADWAASRGHALRPLRLFDGEPLYRIEQAELLVIMGGPMSVHDETEHPWLPFEKQAIRAAIENGKQVVGFCLGAQLIASVLGARVTPNPQPEIGWFPVQPVSTRYFDTPLSMLHWHGETFALPDGAEWLASSTACPHQGFQIGTQVLGWQCHPEVHPSDAESWVIESAADLVAGPYVQDAGRIRAEPASTYAQMHAFLFHMLDQFTTQQTP